MTAAGRAPKLSSPAPEALAPPGPGPRWRRTFPGEERQLGVLRQWIATLLPDGPARDDVACIATELGANAIRHTASGQGGRFEVEITRPGSVVRVAVADGGAPAGPRMIDDPAGETGRGLIIVRGLAAHTGLSGDHRGRLIWADVLWDYPSPGSGYKMTTDHRKAADPRTQQTAPAAEPVPCGCNDSALPRRVVREVPPAALPGRSRPIPGPEILHRVLDGLSKL